MTLSTRLLVTAPALSLASPPSHFPLQQSQTRLRGGFHASVPLDTLFLLPGRPPAASIPACPTPSSANSSSSFRTQPRCPLLQETPVKPRLRPGFSKSLPSQTRASSRAGVLWALHPKAPSPEPGETELALRLRPAPKAPVSALRLPVGPWGPALQHFPPAPPATPRLPQHPAGPWHGRPAP